MQRRCLVAIQPIDLQIIYAQMEKVGKQQGAEQQARANAQDAKKKNNELEAQKKLSTVQEVELEGKESVKINEDGHNKDEQEAKPKNITKNEDEPSEEEEKEIDSIKDPYLGQRIDISG